VAHAGTGDLDEDLSGSGLGLVHVTHLCLTGIGQLESTHLDLLASRMAGRARGRRPRALPTPCGRDRSGETGWACVALTSRLAAMADALRARLTDDLLAARKARDEVRVAVLRTTRAALGNAEAVDAATVPDGVAEAPRRE